MGFDEVLEGRDGMGYPRDPQRIPRLIPSHPVPQNKFSLLMPPLSYPDSVPCHANAKSFPLPSRRVPNTLQATFSSFSTSFVRLGMG